MPRLFTAVDLPARVREDIANICFGVPNVKWTPLEQIHLTLHFVGEVDNGTAQDVAEALSEVRSPGFPLRLRGTGHFPPRKDPRVLWVGAEHSALLLDLFNKIGSALEGAGVEIEKRKFHPHITVGRVREHTTLDAVAPFLVSNSLFSTDQVEVSAFHLYSSILKDSGAIHSLEASYQLMPSR
jgi:RNA 2',3'-cyclic 3'-phosphodiesterase